MEDMGDLNIITGKLFRSIFDEYSWQKGTFLSVTYVYLAYVNDCFISFECFMSLD